MRRTVLAPVGVVVAVAPAGCGGTSHTAATTPATAQATTGAPAAPTTTAAGGPGALQAEANSAAAGDIPDNQVFLVFRNRGARYAMKYPEGWAQRGSGNRVTFRDKNNIVRIVLSVGAAPTISSVQADVGRLRRVRIESSPRAMTIA